MRIDKEAPLPSPLTLSRYRGIAAVLALVVSAAALHADDYTPLVVSTPQPRTYLFPGTDNKLHVVYELMMTNASARPLTVQKVEVIDAADSAKVFASYQASALPLRLMQMVPDPDKSPSAQIESSGSRLFFVDLDLDPNTAPPGRLLHRLTVLAAAPADPSAAPIVTTYTVAPVGIIPRVKEIGPPLAGNSWVAGNGCCAPATPHRSTRIPINGTLSMAQRFAIDWVQLDPQARMVHGDPSDVHNYPGYGANVIAAADGVITETLDTLPNQKPPGNPDRKTVTIDNIAGNHIIQDLGDGVFAIYAHLQPGSLKVKVGDHVKRGQILAHLGNTGNTSMPHLHFHLMDGPSMLGSSGIPYVIDSFSLAGQIFEEPGTPAPPLDASWSKSLFPEPHLRHKQFPLDGNIVNF